jgi:hypothetical protein
MASLLKMEMRRQLRRLDSSDRHKAIRKALADRRRSQGATSRDLAANPCPWWSATDTQAHAAWLSAPAPAPVPWEELNPCKQWSAGQPVLLRTGGHEHIAYVRLVSNTFGPRWLRGSIPERRVSPAELSLRNPRQLWSDGWQIQLAIALLDAETDPRCEWLKDVDEETEPELTDLLLLAREELARRPAQTAGPEPLPLPTPKPRRGWTRRELEAIRMPAGVVKAVDLAPGR